MLLQHEEQQQRHARADQPHRDEPDDLATEVLGQWGSAQRPEIEPTATAHEAPRHAPDTLEVVGGRAANVHPAVGVVDPIDGHFVHAQPVVFGEQQQFGVEEPAVVFHGGQQVSGDVGADGLEAALSVAETYREDRAEDHVVRARDDLAPRAPSHGRTGRKTRSDREVAVSGDERCNEGQQRIEPGRQIDVHVGAHLGLAAAPGLAQGEPATLAVEMDHLDVGELLGASASDVEGRVGARVVDDRDLPTEREVGGQVRVQARDAPLEHVGLVVDRHGHIEHDRSFNRVRGRC